MKKKTAAAYCDLSVGAFEREIVNGTLPSSFMLGGREHWDRLAIDAAVDRITGGPVEREPDYLREWREKYGEPAVAMPEHRRKLRERYEPKSQLVEANEPAPNAYSARTLAERWSRSEGLVRKLVKEGKLATIPFGLLRISAAEVARYEAGGK
jgi:hypothetical protein